MAFNLGHNKMILTLLNKSIVFHVRHTLIGIRTCDFSQPIHDLFSSFCN